MPQREDEGNTERTPTTAVQAAWDDLDRSVARARATATAFAKATEALDDLIPRMAEGSRLAERSGSLELRETLQRTGAELQRIGGELQRMNAELKGYNRAVTRFAKAAIAALNS